MKKNRIMIISAALLLIGTAVMPLWAQNYGRRNTSPGFDRADGPGRAGGNYRSEQGLDIESVISGIEPGTLTSEEEAGILLMREEEKLARDVYLTLSEKWNLPVFANIARSESTHMEAMEMLIERYGLTDPVDNTSPASRGRYSNEEFNTLYTDLIRKGSESLEAALEVGALIEDLDIADLQRLIEESGNDDVRIVYQNLLKGSRNHMRSFYRQIDRAGNDYTPEYISQGDFDRIVSSRNESGVITDPSFLY